MDQILIADDDNIDRKLLETYLSQSKYEVVSTTNGEEAWNIISKNESPPQIVIIDWMMPEMDGITLCKKIREVKSQHYVYIILVTGKTMSADIVQGLEAGADDYLTKPYDKAVLLARINVGARIVSLEREKNEQLQKIQSTNRKLRQNMESAVQIQLSLLPPKNYTIQGFQFDWFFRPSDMLGGDMLHVYKLSDTKVACYVLDVSGHGTEAALLSVTVRNQLTLNSADATAGQNYGGLISLESLVNRPVDVIHELSNHYADLLEKTGHYFTIVYGILDTETGIFDYVSAGHYSPVLISGSKIVVSNESGGPPVGMFKGQEYIQQQVRLSPQDKLYLFTDGIVEEVNNDSDQYGLDRLIDRLRLKSMQSETFDEIIYDLEKWTGKKKFKDDIALVEISRHS